MTKGYKNTKKIYSNFFFNIKKNVKTSRFKKKNINPKKFSSKMIKKEVEFNHKKSFQVNLIINLVNNKYIKEKQEKKRCLQFLSICNSFLQKPTQQFTKKKY